MNFVNIISSNNKCNKIEHLNIFRHRYPLDFCSSEKLKSINNRDKTMPVFKFSNINTIKITCVRFACWCTNKCHRLDLTSINIDIEWYNILISDKCDFSGIKELYICGITILFCLTQTHRSVVILILIMINKKTSINCVKSLLI